MPKDAERRPADELTFEEALIQLETIVSQLEAGELTLDASIALFEQGIRLARTCDDRLTDAKLRITRIEESLGRSVPDDEE